MSVLFRLEVDLDRKRLKQILIQSRLDPNRKKRDKMKSRCVFRMAALLLLAVGLLAGSVARSAENNFAPLIEKETQGIAKINLNKVAFMSILSQASDVADMFIDDLVPKKEDRDSAKSLVRLSLPMMMMPYGNLLEQFKASGAGEFYIVKNEQESELCPFYLAFPADGLDKEQTSKIRGLADYMNENMKFDVQFRYPFVRHGFVIMPAVKGAEAGDNKKIQTFYKQRFKTLNTLENKDINEALALGKDSSVFIVMTKPAPEDNPLLKKFAANDPAMDKEFGQMFSEIQNKLAGKLRYSCYDINLEKLGVQIVSVVNSSDDLKSLDGTMPQIGESVAENVKKQGGSPEAIQNVKKLVELFKPTVDGDKMSWNIDVPFIKSNRALLVETVKLTQTIGEKKTTDPKK